MFTTIIYYIEKSFRLKKISEAEKFGSHKSFSFHVKFYSFFRETDLNPLSAESIVTVYIQ
jgi:hypothetical protein